MHSSECIPEADLIVVVCCIYDTIAIHAFPYLLIQDGGPNLSDC